MFNEGYYRLKVRVPGIRAPRQVTIIVSAETQD